ncbi:MAG: hypothetical protein AB1445_14430 [Bacillota bacterium]
MYGIITVVYEGQLDAGLFSYLDERKARVRRGASLVIECRDVDEVLSGLLGYLSAGKAQVSKIHLRRAA